MYLKDFSDIDVSKEPVCIKGYRVYERTAQTYSSVAVFADNDRCVYRDNYSITPPEKIFDKVKKILFTEEELCIPCVSVEEYRNKQYFLKNIYIEYVNNICLLCEDFTDAYVFDPISDRFVDYKDKDFVMHHIWLFTQFKLCQKPSAFMINGNNVYINLNEYEKEKCFLTYLMILPFAKEDDPRRSEAINYIASHARDMAKFFYEHRQTRIPRQLVLDGYIKKPTMKKLLEMANDREDVEFAAILLDKMKESEVSKNRFSL